MKVISITNLCLGNSASLPERSLYKGLAAKGVDLTVITHWSTPESQDLESSGIKVLYIPVKRKIDLKAIRLIRRKIRDEKTDILHATFSKALTNGLIAASGTGAKVAGYLGSTSLHWYDPTAYLSFLNPRLGKLICLSDGVAEHVIRQSPGLMKGKAVRIYKGYETSWFDNVKPESRDRLGIPGDAFVICCVANVRKLKGIPYLIGSAKYLPENLPVYFVLVGPGMDSAYIRKLISGSGKPVNFISMGFTNEVLKYTSMCDLYIQPSITEGLGRSVIEAMSLSKPVVVSGTGGVEELVEEGTTGFHIPSRSPETIAEKILYFCKNRNTLPAMGKRAKERIETRFNSRQMVEETYQLFSSMLSRQ
jgi:glycosyltransferase involved in cell wall biosynthesis